MLPSAAGRNSCTSAVASMPRSSVSPATAAPRSSQRSNRWMRAPLPPMFGLTRIGYRSRSAAANAWEAWLITRERGNGMPRASNRSSWADLEISNRHCAEPLTTGTSQLSTYCRVRAGRENGVRVPAQVRRRAHAVHQQVVGRTLGRVPPQRCRVDAHVLDAAAVQRPESGRNHSGCSWRMPMRMLRSLRTSAPRIAAAASAAYGTPAAAHPREDQARHVRPAIEIALSIERSGGQVIEKPGNGHPEMRCGGTEVDCSRGPSRDTCGVNVTAVPTAAPSPLDEYRRRLSDRRAAEAVQERRHQVLGNARLITARGRRRRAVAGVPPARPRRLAGSPRRYWCSWPSSYGTTACCVRAHARAGRPNSTSRASRV